MSRLNEQAKQERNALKQQMLAMKNDGKTYQDIADTFGISKQRVHQMVGARDVRYFRHVKKETCIYKGIRKYLNDNQLSIAELVRRVYGCYHPRNFATMRNKLSGRTDISKQYIDKLLEVTGLTYEVAFELESEV